MRPALPAGHDRVVASTPLTATRTRVRIAVFALVCATAAVVGQHAADACTAFCAVGAGQVLVGNNEDWNNPRTRLWFVPANSGSFGRMYVGFDDLRPQGGMNERGLWFDGFATPALIAAGSSDLPRFDGDLVDKAMAECATVEDVVRLFRQYNRSFLTQAVLMFADASGDAVSIEPDAMVRKKTRHFVQTNFHQSLPQGDIQDGRFTTASTMLERAGADISIDLFRRILAATYQKDGYPTLYSNIYELRSRTMHLYYFHDFEHALTFHLEDELAKGAHVLDIPALFPRNAAAETFAAQQKDAAGQRPGPALAIAVFALLALFLFVVVFSWIRAGRGIRVGLAVAAGALVLFVVATAVVLQMHGTASKQWIEFSIGPASGESASIQPSAIRANGITLKAALATAFDMPPVRVIMPEWLAQTRYSINAVAPLNAPESFRSMLQEELKSRLRLETHVELRPFEVFVLTATDAPRLERAAGNSVGIRISRRDVFVREASMDNVAGALQGILGKPVIDETGLPGTYNMQFGWGDNRVESVTAALHDRFGLRLSPGKRDMEALIVDGIRRDGSLVLLAQIGRGTRGAPQYVRERIADALRIR